MLRDDCYAVVMAGGAGSRLWPLSRREVPKHFLKLFDGKSLIELTVDKISKILPPERIVILTSVKYREVAQQTLPQIPDENFVYEPCLRDTASAIGLAATVLKTRKLTATMIVLTADQIIEPVDRFNAAIVNAVDFLGWHPDRLIAFGVEATSPSTLVGWQELGNAIDFAARQVREIDSFTEKPNLEVAKRYVEEGGYCWNSGQFAWRAETILREIDAYLPEATPLLKRIGEAWNSANREQVLADVYPQMAHGSIDYQVMQRTNKACSILLPCSWEDMGTHAALAGKIGEQRSGNLVVGDAVIMGKGNCVLSNTNQRVVVASDNLTVAVIDGIVYVGDRGADMKAVLQQVAQQKPDLM